MKKLLIIIGSLSYGGAEMQTLELANGLIEFNYSVDIVVLNNKEELRSKASPEICIHMMSKKSYLDFAVVKKLKGLIIDNKHDIILCVDLYPMLYLQFALGINAMSYRTAVVFHSTLPQNLKDQFQRCYLVLLTRWASQLIFVSTNQMRYWTAKWNIKQERCVVINNGINIERFDNYLQNETEIQKMKKSLGFHTDDIVVGTCSNFRPEKRQQDLIQVCARLKDKGYSIKVLLIGDGEMRNAIEDQVHILGMDKEVFITGFVPDVRPYLAVLDIFVLTSSSIETLSIAAIESQAMKKAAILSDIGGASEIVIDGVNGFLYPVCNVNLLMEKLETIVSEKMWKAMGEAGHHHAARFFHKNRMIQTYNKLFQEMTS